MLLEQRVKTNDTVTKKGSNRSIQAPCQQLAVVFLVSVFVYFHQSQQRVKTKDTITKKGNSINRPTQYTRKQLAAVFPLSSFVTATSEDKGHSHQKGEVTDQLEQYPSIFAVTICHSNE